MLKTILSYGVTIGLGVVARNLVKATTPTSYSCSAKITLEVIGFVTGIAVGYKAKDIIIDTTENLLKKEDEKEEKK